MGVGGRTGRGLGLRGSRGARQRRVMCCRCLPACQFRHTGVRACVYGGGGSTSALGDMGCLWIAHLRRSRPRCLVGARMSNRDTSPPSHRDGVGLNSGNG